MKFNIEVKTDIKTEEAVKGLRRVLWLSMLKMKELAVQKCPVDTGRLRSSIILQPTTPNSDRYILSDGVSYGVCVEMGTRPHPVSYKNLVGWARRKLGNSKLAFAVAKKIQKYGTRPQPFFRPALDEVRKIHLKRYMNKVFGNG